MRRMREKKLACESDNPTASSPVYPFTPAGGCLDPGSRSKLGLSERDITISIDMHGTRVKCNTLVLGMGSEFLGDDGLGVHALRSLAKENLPPGTELIEIANHLVDALVALQRADRVILLDVLRAKGKPGSVYRVSFQSVQMSEGTPLSLNHDLLRALHLGGCLGFLDVILIGMEPSVVECSTNLSSEVRDALPLMIRAVRAELDRPVARSLVEETIPFAEKPISDHCAEGLRRRYPS